MKFALISDIHGNAPALKRVLEEIKKQKIERIFIMGDFLGYYYDHDKVFQLLKPVKWQAVQGNHDAILSIFLAGNRRLMRNYRAQYGHSLDLALKILTKKQIATLINLPKTYELKIDGKKLLLCHGSPWDQNKHVYSDSHRKTFERIFKLDYDYVILGHSHHPFIKKQGKKTIINTGSVGQPRDQGSSASWFIADLKNQNIELQRTSFSPIQIIKKIEKNDPDNIYLKKVLSRKCQK